jgi:hypothetical protein
MSDADPTPPAPRTPTTQTRLPAGMSKILVVAMGVGMVVLIVAVTFLPPTQVRLPLEPGSAWSDALIIEGTARALRTLEVEPIEPITPNPDHRVGPASDPAPDPPPQPPAGEAVSAFPSAVAEDPDRPIYQTVYWRARVAGDDQPQRWRVTVKRLEDEFIAWPRRVD